MKNHHHHVNFLKIKKFIKILMEYNSLAQSSESKMNIE